MAVATSTAIIAASVIAAGTTLAATSMAPKPQSPQAMAALPKSEVAQVSKQADKETANAITSAKKRSGVATPNTLLTGSQGVADEELNLGGSRLI